MTLFSSSEFACFVIFTAKIHLDVASDMCSTVVDMLEDEYSFELDATGTSWVASVRF